jgi:Na+/melibiose symporter-like transporter
MKRGQLNIVSRATAALHLSYASAQTATGGRSPGASLTHILFHPSTQQEVNHRNVVFDAIGVGITAGVGSFLAVFLVRLGATNTQVGLLTAMPALTGMLLSIPVGEFLSRRTNIVPWFARSRFAVLICYVLTGLVPFFIPEQATPTAIIAIWAVATLPQTMVSVAFTVVMGAVAGPGGRLNLMSHRWSVLGLTNSLTVLIVGQILPIFDFPLNYQLVFIGSGIGALISVVMSSTLKLPSLAAPAAPQNLIQTFRQHGRTLRTNRPFVRFAASSFVFRWGMMMAGPLFPIYWVKNVEATDPAIGVINSTQTLVMMFGYYLWSRMSRRRGERWVLLITTLGVSFYPLLTALTKQVQPLVVWAALAGLFSAGVDLVFFDILLDSCPADYQAAYVGMFQSTVFLAAFLAPLVGTAMASSVGIVPALIAASFVRFAGFGLMLVLGVGKESH